jgi:hypothetical protein
MRKLKEENIANFITTKARGSMLEGSGLVPNKRK